MLFGLAIITHATRTYIRARILKQFSTEDVFLLFAVICLCCSTGLAYSAMQNLYDSLAVILHGGQSGLIFSILDHLPETSKETNAETTLWWLVIFPVKLAYLFFFRRLISRLRDLNTWWWCVIVFTVPAGLISIAVCWLTCPYFTIKGVLCKCCLSQAHVAHTKPLLACTGSSTNTRVVRDSTVTIVLDIVTDFLVVSIPIALLWRVRINVRQKIGLAISLCLSLVMVITAIVRISGIKLAGGAIDIVWEAFWIQQECSIAVIMVSASAFRSFFVPNSSRSIAPDPPKPSSYWRKRLLLKRPISDKDDWKGGNELPQIPRATLTGMRSAIREAGMSATDDVA